PAGATATKLIATAVAGPNGTPHVPATKKFLVVPAPMGDPLRVSMTRHGVTGTKTRSTPVLPYAWTPVPPLPASIWLSASKGSGLVQARGAVTRIKGPARRAFLTRNEGLGDRLLHRRVLPDLCSSWIIRLRMDTRSDHQEPSQATNRHHCPEPQFQSHVAPP